MPSIHVLRAALAVAFAWLSWSASVRAACPDNVVDGVETCDDGNTADGDGCDSSCRREAGYLCTGSPSLCCFANAAAGYDLIGSASVNNATGEVILTPDAVGLFGYAWFRSRVNFATDFSVALQLYLGDHDGADGGSIMFQRDPLGSAATGGVGGYLGANNILPLVAVEFDTYDNGDYGDLADDHTSIFHETVENQLTSSACLRRWL